jgi:hypothetical protein
MLVSVNRDRYKDLAEAMQVWMKPIMVEHSVDIQGTFNKHSVNIQWTFSEHSANKTKELRPKNVCILVPRMVYGPRLRLRPNEGLGFRV